jgi:hypothetical protein
MSAIDQYPNDLNRRGQQTNGDLSGLFWPLTEKYLA